MSFTCCKCICALLLASALFGCSGLPPHRPAEVAAAAGPVIDGKRMLRTFHTTVLLDSFEFSVSAVSSKAQIPSRLIETPDDVFFVRWRTDAEVFVPIAKVEKRDILRIGRGKYMYSLPYVAIQTRDYKFYAFICSAECEPFAVSLEELVRANTTTR